MKIAFWSVFVLGFVLCSTVGIGPTLQRVGGSWTAPAMVAGSLIGVALLVLAVMFAVGVRPAILPTDTAMLVALGTLVASKVAVAVAQAALTAG
jgi:hypothetical protein